MTRDAINAELMTLKKALPDTACIATMVGWLLATMLLRLPVWDESKPIFP